MAMAEREFVKAKIVMEIVNILNAGQREFIAKAYTEEYATSQDQLKGDIWIRRNLDTWQDHRTYTILFARESKVSKMFTEMEEARNLSLYGFLMSWKFKFPEAWGLLKSSTAGPPEYEYVEKLVNGVKTRRYIYPGPPTLRSPAEAEAQWFRDEFAKAINKEPWLEKNL